MQRFIPILETFFYSAWCWRINTGPLDKWAAEGKSEPPTWPAVNQFAFIRTGNTISIQATTPWTNLNIQSADVSIFQYQVTARVLKF